MRSPGHVLAPREGELALVCRHVPDDTSTGIQMCFWPVEGDVRLSGLRIDYVGACQHCYLAAEGDVTRVEFTQMHRLGADSTPVEPS